MGEFPGRLKSAHQMHHTGVKISRQVAVLRQKLPCVIIRQITFQRMRPVGIDQGMPFTDPERYNTNASGNQFPV